MSGVVYVVFEKYRPFAKYITPGYRPTIVYRFQKMNRRPKRTWIAYVERRVTEKCRPEKLLLYEFIGPFLVIEPPLRHRFIGRDGTIRHHTPRDRVIGRRKPCYTVVQVTFN